MIKTKPNKTKNPNQAWSLLTIINWKYLLCYWTYMHIFVDFIHSPECAYLTIGNSLEMGYSMRFFFLHMKVAVTHRLHTLIEYTDIPQPATVLCTTYFSHISTAEVNKYRDLGIATWKFFLIFFRPCWPLSSLILGTCRSPDSKR